MAEPPSRRRQLGSRLGPLADELADAIGAAHVVSDPDVTSGLRTDWTGRFGGHRALVARPGSAAEVAAVLTVAAAPAVPVVTQGGNTGLVGGSVPGAHDSVILSTARLRELGEPDLAAGQVTVGAGVTLTTLGEHLRGTGWRYAVDIGARDTATIGGTIATNAGGMRVFRHGSTRQQALGLEYVLADGSVVTRLGGLVKDNTGYDLAGLLCGSEGTLAVVTRARLRLVPEAPERTTALIGLASRSDAFDAAWELRRRCGAVEVIEFMSGPCYDLVSEAYGIPEPFGAAAVLLVEAADADDPAERLGAALAEIGLGGADAPIAVAANASQRAALWRFRDDLTVALAGLGTVLKYDVSVPAQGLDRFCEAVTAAVGAFEGATAWLFGHVCDDNVHVNVTGAADRSDEVDDAVLRLVAAHGGSISAEHGIGRAKAGYLHLARSPAEIAQMRAIKTAFDPDGLLNPGVLLA